MDWAVERERIEKVLKWCWDLEKKTREIEEKEEWSKKKGMISREGEKRESMKEDIKKLNWE